jgi:capsule polysaccharide export protein KpsC/LpsZ
LLGYPFYAGWGLTDDRQTDARRSRKLTTTQLFAAAYLLYPRYFDPISGEACRLRDVIRSIRAEQGASPLL